MSFDLLYVNVLYSPQHNSKVGRKDNFRLPQSNCNKYFLKFNFLNESIKFDFFRHFHYTLSVIKKSGLFYLKLFQT